MFNSFYTGQFSQIDRYKKSRQVTFATLRQVTLPLSGRGIAAGAVFAFLVSFDEVVISKFLSGSRAVTLPKRMLDGVFYEMTPMLAAVSVLLVVMNMALALVGLALARQRRA